MLSPYNCNRIHIQYRITLEAAQEDEDRRVRESSLHALAQLIAHAYVVCNSVYLDFATEPSTLRQAWSEIRDGIDRGE